MGEWEGGLYRKKFAERDPIALRMLAEQRWDVIPGAEPAAEFSHRVQSMITRIAAAHVGERIAVFTHAGVIGEALSQASGAEPFAFIGPNNASISQILVTPDRWVVRRFNDASHLDAASHGTRDRAGGLGAHGPDGLEWRRFHRVLLVLRFGSGTEAVRRDDRVLVELGNDLLPEHLEHLQRFLVGDPVGDAESELVDAGVDIGQQLLADLFGVPAEEETGLNGRIDLARFELARGMRPASAEEGAGRERVVVQGDQRPDVTARLASDLVPSPLAVLGAAHATGDHGVVVHELPDRVGAAGDRLLVLGHPAGRAGARSRR